MTAMPIVTSSFITISAGMMYMQLNGGNSRDRRLSPFVSCRYSRERPANLQRRHARGRLVGALP